MTHGALVMSYGSPAGPNFVRTYYTDIRRGRPPSDDQLAELKRRYAVIGGISPLQERTGAQSRAIAAALDVLEPKSWATLIGTKHSLPTIENAVREAARTGLDRLVGVVLAPHYAAASVGEYLERATVAAAEAGIGATFIERYGADPALVTILAGRVREAMASCAGDPGATEVVFTAHALPIAALGPDDRYAEEIAETAALVAEAAGVTRFRTGWQSAGMTAQPWLGPDITVTLEALARDGVSNVVICPCGFTSDHLEVLYDIDVVAAGRGVELGIGLVRTRSLNDDPRFAALLARRIVTG